MSLRTKEQLEGWYAIPDPWGYQTSPDDRVRKAQILAACRDGGFIAKRALDVGAGEGWITKDLPALRIDALELSDLAAHRFPDNVRRVHKPQGSYDLVVATGVFYEHYEWEKLHGIVLRVATGRVVTCHIEDHEIPLPGKAVRTVAFPYHAAGKKVLEVLRVYEF